MKQLKAHEFHCTLRHLKNSGKTWSEIYLRLGEVSTEAMTKYLKTLSSLFVIYVVLSSLAKDGKVTISILQYQASVPTAYVLAVASVLLLVSFQHLITFLTLFDVRSRESSRLRLSRFSASTFGLYNGQDEMALATPIAVNIFFHDRLRVSRFLDFVYSLALSISLSPIIALIVFLVTWQFDLAFESPRNLGEGLTAFFSLAVTSMAVFYFAVFLIPIPMQKNAFGIRWGFLSRMCSPGRHPQFRRWLEEEDTKP